MENKLGIVVPYRNRPEQLKIFREEISKYLYDRNIHHEVIVVEQKDDKAFNRGLLCNWGFRKAIWAGCSYVAFHDVDLIPESVDYSYPESPTHLISDLGSKEVNDELFYDYFGGVTMFNVKDFEKINGFSNDYWGWGFEDDDLFQRVLSKRIRTDNFTYPQRRHDGIGLRFNGKDSYGILKNNFGSRSFSLFGSFTIDKITPNTEQEYDELTVFSFPGHDTCLTYRSFMNFSLELWDRELNSFSTFTKKRPLGSYNFATTFDITEKLMVVTLYINGEYISRIELENPKRLTSRLLLGVGNPNRETKNNYFEGLINNFAIYRGVLNNKEIKELSENTTYSLFNFESSNNLLHYYDSKFIKGDMLLDLVGRNNCFLKNVTQEKITEIKSTKVPKPHRRRGKFKALSHKNSGFDKTWNDWGSRINQAKYFEKLSKNKFNTSKDGLNSYWGELVDEFTELNYNHLYVKS